MCRVTDVQHEKYARLMAEVEALEDQVVALETSGNNPDELKRLMAALGEARVRLSRLSAGCGPSRAPGA